MLLKFLRVFLQKTLLSNLLSNTFFIKHNQYKELVYRTYQKSLAIIKNHIIVLAMIIFKWLWGHITTLPASSKGHNYRFFFKYCHTGIPLLAQDITSHLLQYIIVIVSTCRCSFCKLWMPNCIPEQLLLKSHVWLNWGLKKPDLQWRDRHSDHWASAIHLVQNKMKKKRGKTSISRGGGGKKGIDVCRIR